MYICICKKCIVSQYDTIPTHQTYMHGSEYLLVSKMCVLHSALQRSWDHDCRF